MIRLSAILATGLVVASAAFAQTNVPPGQSVCAMGYDKGKDDPRLKSAANSEAFKKADKNNNGMLEKIEFDSACADRLFKEQEKGGG